MSKAQISSELLDELTRTKIRVNIANAEKNELKNAVTRGELITVEAVNKKWAEDVSNVKAKLLAIPTKLTPILSNQVLTAQDVNKILTEAIYEALNELSEEYKA